MEEYLDIVNDNGEPTGQIIDRATAHEKGIPHRTAHVWLLRHHKGRVQILLQKRCATKASYPNCYDISSAGHIPAGVDYIPSALRELQEELGVTVSPEELILCGDRSITADDVFFGKPFHDRQYSRVFLLWLDQEASDFRIQQEEVDSVRWMDFEECVDGVRRNTFPHCIALEELMMLSPHFTDEGRE